MYIWCEILPSRMILEIKNMLTLTSSIIALVKYSTYTVMADFFSDGIDQITNCPLSLAHRSVHLRIRYLSTIADKVGITCTQNLPPFAPTSNLHVATRIHLWPCVCFLLQVQRTEVLYWKVENPEHYAAPNFPCLIAYTDVDHFYALPAMEYPGLFKVCVPAKSFSLTSKQKLLASWIFLACRCAFMAGLQRILMREIGILIVPRSL